MAFVTKTWKDRLVEYAGRRKLKNVATGEEILMDVSRSEGTVNQAGDAFSATNMNDLEQRIKTEFDSVNSSLADGQISFDVINGEPYVKVGADTPRPFSVEKHSFYLDYKNNPTKTIVFDRSYNSIPSVYITLADSTGKPTASFYGGYRPYVSSVTKSQAIVNLTSVSETVGAYVAVAVVSNG